MRLVHRTDRGGFMLLLTGIVVGMLIAGLAVPLTFGNRVEHGDQSTALTGGETLPPTASPEEIFDGDGIGPAIADAAGPRTDPAAAQTGEGATDGAGPGAPAGVPLRATDRGVTATDIKLGFLLLDVGSLSRVGIAVPGVDPDEQREAFEAQLAEINERGGIHGRQLTGAYENFDVLSQDDMLRACLALRDQGVFGIVAAGGFFGPPILCITEEGQTPFVTFGADGIPTEYVRRSGGRLFSLFPVSERLNLNWVAELDRLGVLRGKRIGIVSQQNLNPGNSVVGGEIEPALERFGYEAVHTSDLSADMNTASSQIPVEVQRMQAQDVDLILLTVRSLNATQWVQTADSQLYHPEYVLTDWASMNNDVSNQNMPASYDGALLVTTHRIGEERVGVVEENPAQKECRRIFEEGTGRQLGPKGANDHGLIHGNCTALKALTLGLELAGPELTRPSWSRGMQSIGEFPMTMWGGGSFGPEKFGAANLLRSARWLADCRCLTPIDDFRQPRF